MGNGLNLRHYPDTVGELVAVEPEAYLRERAREAAARAPVPVRVVDGLAEALPLDDASVDAAVVSLVLCSVLDQGRALAELMRVIRPGGEPRFYEHVRARDPRVARVQRAAGLIWPRLGGGCHPDREHRCGDRARRVCDRALPALLVSAVPPGRARRAARARDRPASG